MKSLPVQQDGINGGVYSLLHLLVASHGDMPINDLNPKRFRDQLLLYSVCLELFQLHFQSKSYTFPKTFEMIDILKRPFRKNSNVHKIMTSFLDQKQITQASTIAYDFEEWSVSFNKVYKKSELCDIMCIKFPSVLNNLTYVHDAKMLLQIHWNLVKQENIQREFKEEMINIFTDEGDCSFFEALLKKNTTFIFSLKA